MCESGFGSGEPSGEGPRGIFITEGARIVVPAGGLSIRVTDEGEVEAGPLVLHLALDMCPYWLEVGRDHVHAARDVNVRLLAAVGREDDGLIGAELHGEFLAGMQAIVAAAVSVDALYASVRDRIELPEDLVETWRENRTARHRQIFEVLRRALDLDRGNHETLREMLRELMRFRDLAVHPGARAKAPAHHPDLDRGTEWRFVAFRYSNARTAVRMALALSWYVSGRSSRMGDGLTDYLEGLRTRLDPLKMSWESDFGPIYDEAAASGTDDTEGSA